MPTQIKANVKRRNVASLNFDKKCISCFEMKAILSIYECVGEGILRPGGGVHPP
jgi:hypothetical protein